MEHNNFNSNFTIFGKSAQHSPSFLPDMDPDFAVKDLLYIGESSLLYGQPAVGKTAIIAAIAAHSALGRDFADCLTQKTVVIYFAAEDSTGVHKRAYPYLSSSEFSSAPFYVIPTGFDMTDNRAVNTVIDFVKRVMEHHNTKQSLVVFDTLNRMLGLNDENSSAVIGTYLANTEKIAKAANAACLTIHHSGKGNTRSARGSSAISSNADNVFRLECSKNDKNLIHLVPEKMKSVEIKRILGFRLESHFVGIDRDGEDVCFPKAVPQGATGVINKTPANDNRPVKNQSDERKDEVLRVLNEEATVGGNAGLTPPQISERTGEAFRKVRDNRDSHIKAVKRSLKSLVEQEVVENSGGLFKIKPKAIDETQPLNV